MAEPGNARRRHARGNPAKRGRPQKRFIEDYRGARRRPSAFGQIRTFDAVMESAEPQSEPVAQTVNDSRLRVFDVRLIPRVALASGLRRSRDEPLTYEAI